MEFKIVRAVPEDAEVLSKIMDFVAEGMPNPQWFIRDDLDFIKKHIGTEPVSDKDFGFILKAIPCRAVENHLFYDSAGEPIAGFFQVAFPGTGEKNLGHHLGYSIEELKKVAHMDSVVILPEYRGYGLQYRLMDESEQIIAKETAYCTLLTTVHPDNKYSLNNVMSRGYQVMAEVIKYGKYRRYVLKKEMV